MMQNIKHTSNEEPFPKRRGIHSGWWVGFGLALALQAAFPAPVEASIFQGETLDKVADVLTWIVLVIAPVAAITIFLLIHILPEKIAEKKHHPQAKAIQCLCLLSLVFGGLLWPLAWLWAYTKPVFHQMAYGTDRSKHGDGEDAQADAGAAEESQLLKKRIAELENKLAAAHAAPEQRKA